MKRPTINYPFYYLSCVYDWLINLVTRETPPDHHVTFSVEKLNWGGGFDNCQLQGAVTCHSLSVWLKPNKTSRRKSYIHPDSIVLLLCFLN